MKVPERKKPGEEAPFKSGFTALIGLLLAFRTESSIRGFTFFGLFFIIGAIIFRFHFLSIALLILSWSLIVLAEVINTSIETAIDFVSKEYHPKIRKTKDFAAGAVCLAALSGWTVTALVFAHHFLAKS